MPYLQLQTVKGVLSPEQKTYLMDRFTALLVEVEGGGNPEFAKKVWIRIDESEAGNWQLGELRPTAGLIERMANARDAGRESVATPENRK
jgi:4-oxalocrotonate tautomerase